MVQILVVHFNPDLFHTKVVKIHGEDLLAIFTQILKVFIKQIGQVIL
jgi:hypothetical protein